MMQPIAGGFDLDRSRFSKLHQWIENVKKQSQPFFDEAHSFPMKLRQKILDEEKKSKWREHIPQENKRWIFFHFFSWKKKRFSFFN